MSDVILTSIRSILVGTDTSFDAELIMHINGVFLILNQMGVGPTTPYYLTAQTASTATWADFLGTSWNNKLELVKTYMAMKVRMVFDPPTSGTVLKSFETIIKEYEWRLNVAVDPGPSSST